MKEKLKPCPFCGEIPEVLKYEEKYYISCRDYNCKVNPITNFRKTKKTVIKYWNKRLF